MSFPGPEFEISSVVITPDIFPQKESSSYKKILNNAICVVLFPEGVVLGIKARRESVKIKQIESVVCAAVGEYQDLNNLLNLFKGFEIYTEYDVGDAFYHMRGPGVSTILAQTIKHKYENKSGVYKAEFLVVDITNPDEGSSLPIPLPKCWVFGFEGMGSPFHGGLLGLQSFYPNPPRDKPPLISKEEIVDDAARKAKEEEIKKYQAKVELYLADLEEKFLKTREEVHNFLETKSGNAKDLRDGFSVAAIGLKKLLSIDEFCWGADKHTIEIVSYYIGEDGYLKGRFLKTSREKLIILDESRLEEMTLEDIINNLKLES